MFCFVFQTPEEEDRFCYLYEKYHKLFYKVAYDILHNHQDAEDALQISLEIIYRYFYKIKDEIEKKCVGYMIVIIRNESIDLFNTRKKILVANEDVMDRKHFMQRENENRFLKNQELKEAIKKLDDKYRDILLLKYVYGYSMKEIAKMLKITETNVSTRLERGRKQLKNKMEQGVDEHEDK